MSTANVDPQLSGNELSVAERKLLHAAATGGLVDLRVGDTELRPPGPGVTCGTDRTVRASVLVELLTSKRSPEGGRPRAVKVRGARVTGVLDLEAAELACPLLLQECYFEEPINLKEAVAPAIRLPGCHVPGFAANQLRTTGNLELDRSFISQGEVGLIGAHIGGQLSLSGARLINRGGLALVGDGLTVDQGMSCRRGFVAEGEVRLIGAHIGGQLSLSGARLINRGGLALVGDGLTVGQSMFCQEGFVAEGEVRLPGGHIGGYLDLNGAHLTGTGGRALIADGLTVDQSMFCREGFVAGGEVRMTGAHIGRVFFLGQADLINPSGTALSADSLTVDLHMFCSEGLSAEGEVSLLGAHIGGQLILDGAHLTNTGGTALTADHLTVDQSMHCGEGFTIDGEVRLAGAHIGGYLDLNGAHLTNTGRPALTAQRLTVKRDMFCGEGFTVEGEVRLQGAHIGGQLDLSLASLSNPEGLALDLEAAQVTHLILWLVKSPQGGVRLTNARVGVFQDDQATWPVTLRLDGFAYDTLETNQVSVRNRLRWLTRHAGGYMPQLYDQLAAVYRRGGHEAAARQVMIAKQWRRRAAVNPAGKLLNWLLYVTVGYGYRTWLAAIWLAGLLALGTWAFARAYPAHMTALGTRPPGFHAFGYTLDVLLPIVDLGQQEAWQPHGAALYWSWALIAAGWVLTTAVVAGLTGILKRD